MTSTSSNSSPTNPRASEPVVFFGSGPVAARCLELLAEAFPIEAVITKPKPPHHKGSFPVLDITERLHTPTYTVVSKAELSKLISIKSFRSRLGVLIDFGIIIAQDVIDSFPLGIVNSHFSILPEWRGADPISFAILSGQKQTGVSLMLLVEKMDEGPLLAYGTYDLPPAITTPELTDHLIKLSHALLLDMLPNYLAGELKGMPQSITKRSLSYSRKLTKEDGIIDWTKPANQLDREIRAFIGWPGSRTVLAGTEVIITKARSAADYQLPVVSVKPGTPFITDQKELAVIAGDGVLIIKRLKPAGKRDMAAQEFLAGHKL